MPAERIDYPRFAFDAIDEFDRKTTAQEVIDHMGKTLACFGFNSFLMASIPNAPDDVLKQIALMDRWPAGWSELYEQNNYFRSDPIAKYGLKFLEPFKWSDVKVDRNIDRVGAEVMNAATDFGLKEGFSIPIVRTDSIDAVTLAGEKPDFDPQALRAIHLIGLYAHSKALAFIRRNSVSQKQLLSPGEREALTWVAAGKSSWEISVILRIAESTVIWRLQRACKKLKAVNRMQAIAIAIREKEIRV